MAILPPRAHHRPQRRLLNHQRKVIEAASYRRIAGQTDYWNESLGSTFAAKSSILKGFVRSCVPESRTPLWTMAFGWRVAGSEQHL
jgi:hypothetical protein